MTVATHQIGKEICDALGLDGSLVQSMMISFVSGDVVRIEANIHPTRDQILKVAAVLKRYELKEKTQ